MATFAPPATDEIVSTDKSENWQPPEGDEILSPSTTAKAAPQPLKYEPLPTPGTLGQMWEAFWKAPKSVEDIVDVERGIRQTERDTTTKIREMAAKHGYNPDDFAKAPGAVDMVAQGAADELVNLAKTAISPGGILTLEIGTAVKIPSAIKRIMSLAFAAQMLKQTPETAKVFISEMKKPADQRDYRVIGETGAGTIANTLLATLGLAHAVAPEVKPPGGQNAGNQVKTPSGIPAVERQPVVPKTEGQVEAGTAQRPGEGEVAKPPGQGAAPRPPGNAVTKSEAAQKMADDAGVRFDGEINGIWNFTAYDKAGKEHTSFITKAGVSKDQFLAKYNQIRDAYAEEPENAPRPARTETPPEKKPEEIKTPELQDGERLVKVVNPDGTSFIASYSDKVEDYSDVGMGIRAGIGKVVEGNWSHGITGEGAKIEELPVEQNKAKSNPKWQVTVQSPTKLENGNEVPGYVQIDDGQDRWSSSPEKLRAKGYDVPDFSKLPQGQYSFGEAQQMLKEPPKPAEKEPVVESVTPLEPQSGKPIVPQNVPHGTKNVPQPADQVLSKSKMVRIKAPPGATMIKITADGGKKAIQPLSALKKFNPFQGVNIEKIEVGTMGRGNKFIPMEGDVQIQPKLVGMGGALAEGEPSKGELAQLSDSMKSLATATPNMGGASKAFTLGKTVTSAQNAATQAITGLRAAGSYLRSKLNGYPVWNSWKAALGDRHLALSESAANGKEFVKTATQAVPDELSQEAISDYIDTGGDRALLAKGELETKPRYKAGYTAAQNLTPEQVSIAQNAKNYFEARLDDAQQAGILEDGIEDYIHRYYEGESQFKQNTLNELRSGIFTGRPALAKKRVFEYDLDAEKAGLHPVKSFIKRIVAYDLSLNKAIADRQAVKAMTQIKMPDGRPMADVAGIGTRVEGEGGTATLIRPSVKHKDPNNPINDRGDYKSRDYAPLRRWRWATADEQGNPIFVKGDVLIHPDAVKQVDNLFKRSAVRQNPIGRAALATGSTVKQTMLDLSGFHPVQITVHGWEHRTFKPVGKIDFENPDVRGLIRGGAVVGETTGRQLFDEGLSGSSLTKHIPYVGKKLQAYNEWLFNDYIPRLKMAMGLHALERNRARFPNMPEDEMYHMTANQMNNAFGELNYDMIGRSKTTQDMMRIALLAPDFLEARAGFVGQALTRHGGEQLSALALGAATLYITARIINKMLTGEYRFEPKDAFSVVYNKKAYSLRTVQGDLLHLITEPGKFVYNRLNPVFGRTLMEFFTKRDIFGRQRSGLEQLKDFAQTIVPISMRGLLNPREQSLWDSFLNSIGITERRSTAASTISQLADNFKKANNIATEPGEFIYDPEKDPYRGIKSAATFADVNTTANEIRKAIKAGHTPESIWKHFVSYSQRPFTGSRRNDIKFYSELGEDNRRIYNDAIRERREMIDKFRAAWEIAVPQHPATAELQGGGDETPGRSQQAYQDLLQNQ